MFSSRRHQREAGPQNSRHTPALSNAAVRSRVQRDCSQRKQLLRVWSVAEHEALGLRTFPLCSDSNCTSEAKLKSTKTGIEQLLWVCTRGLSPTPSSSGLSLQGGRVTERLGMLSHRAGTGTIRGAVGGKGKCEGPASHSGGQRRLVVGGQST